MRLRAAQQEAIPQATAGDICAVLGLRDVVTGDTLSADLDLFLERPTFPEPVVSLAIEPCTNEDQERMGIALQRLIAEDPTLRCQTEPSTGQTLLSGMGELHLEIIRDRMVREFHVETTAGKPQIAFKETIARSAQAEGEFKRQNGGEILADLSRRRGEIQKVVANGQACSVKAQVPLQTLFGYARDIRSLSKGRASYVMAPSHYAILPIQALAGPA